MDLLGTLSIPFSYEKFSQYREFEHRFWVYNKFAGDSNLIGMDFLDKECQSINFERNVLILKQNRSNLVIPLSTTCLKNSPYVSQLYAVHLPSTTYLQPHCLSKVTLPLVNKLNKEGFIFKPEQNRRLSKVTIYETYHDKSSSLPLLIENSNDHLVTIKPGSIGYLERDYTPHIPKYNVRDHNAFEKYLSAIEDLDGNSIEDKLNVFTIGRNAQPSPNTDLHKQFNFSKSKLTTDELNRLSSLITRFSDTYAHHKFNIGCTTQKFHITLKPDADFRKQRPSKVPIQYREKIQDLLDKLASAGIIEEM